MLRAMHVFEYAVIRLVPRVEREEFLNVGVVLFCPAEGFLQVRYHLPTERLRAFADLDLDDIACRLQAFEKICAGGPEGGPIGQLDRAARFRWLTANRSTIVQTSPLHPGLTADAAATLERLYQNLVL